MQRRIRIGMAACMAVAALSWVGCASLNEKLNKRLLDYATADAGATVQSTGSNGERTVDSLINGVADSSKWSLGEGWEYTWTLTEEQCRQCSLGNQNAVQKRGIEGAVAKGVPWVIITFDKPKRINQIVIHEAGGPNASTAGIENAFLQVRNMSSKFQPWRTVATVQSGWGLVPGRQRFRMKPTSKFLFNTVKTDQVRIIINTMTEKKRTEAAQTPLGALEKSVAMTVRLMEIEVKGSEAETPIPRSRIKSSNDSAKKSAMEEPIGLSAFDGTL